MPRILLTGATGLVGAAVAARLLERTDHELLILSRGKGNEDAFHRVVHALDEQFELDGSACTHARFANRMRVVACDLADLDANDSDLLSILSGVHAILHCAADVNLGKDPYGHTYINNCKGTGNLLALAKRLPRLPGGFHAVSTAYVAGIHKGTAMEDGLLYNPFNNAYERSKHHCEEMVRGSGLPFTIYRPSIVVGRMADGLIRKPLAFYRVLEFVGALKRHQCSKRKLSPCAPVEMPFRIEAKPSRKIYFVPIDYVQMAIAELCQRPATGTTYHLTGQSPVSTDDICEATGSVLRVRGIAVAEAVSNPSAQEKLVKKLIGDLLPYFSSEADFDVTNSRAALGEASLDWRIGLDGLKMLISGFYSRAFPSLKVAFPPPC